MRHFAQSCTAGPTVDDILQAAGVWGGRRSDRRAKDPVVVQLEIIGRQFDVVCDDENVINIDRSLLSAR